MRNRIEPQFLGSRPDNFGPAPNGPSVISETQMIAVRKVVIRQSLFVGLAIAAAGYLLGAKFAHDRLPNIPNWVNYAMLVVPALAYWGVAVVWQRSRVPRLQARLQSALRTGNQRQARSYIYKMISIRFSARYGAGIFFLGGLLAVYLGAASPPSPLEATEVNLDPPPACRVGPPRTVPPIQATVTGYVSSSAALEMIQATERATGGTIDPAYVQNQRVHVRTAGGRSVVVLVPLGMDVSPGEEVSFTPGHGEAAPGCVYIPNLIVPSA